MNLLSTATKESIGQINTILKNVDRSSSFVSNSIDNCVDSYDTSKDIFRSIKESFEIINNSANLLESDMKKVYGDVSLINTSTHEINQKSLLLYKASEEISNKTQEVAAVTEEELAELEEINNYTSSLQTMLTGIENLVKKFRTSVVPIDADSPRQFRITFIGPLDHEFWYGVRQGVLYAKKELSERNIVIDYLGFKQDVGQQIKKSAKEALENGSNGIIVPGFDPDLVEIIETASRKGIPFMLYNCDFPVESKRVAYFGPDVNASGTLAARLMVKEIGGKGDIVILTGGLDAFVHRTRRDTILAELKKSKGIKIYSEAQCADSADESYRTTKDLLRQNSNIRGIFVTGGGMGAVAKAVEELGFSGRTFVVCFDYNKEIFEYIKKGIITAAIGQDPFGQGHDPIIYLYNMLVSGQKPENDIIRTRLEVVDKNNVNDLL
jgi:methyl-accepting chemotaxis protein/ribose transport system substrate-binding protein